jgi:hypothetical protein
MTIYHPRVGFEVTSVNAGGTTDPLDATAVPLSVGKTLLLVFPPVGWSAGSGLPPGGIAIVGGTAGDEVLLRASDSNSYASGSKVYLPPGETIGSATFFTVGAGGGGFVGGVTHIIKISATEWTFDQN